MMIIDAHCHLCGEENPPEKMIQIMDAGGVDKAVIFAPACENLPSVPAALLWVARTLLQTPFAKVARNIYEDATASRPGKLKASGNFYDIHVKMDNAVVAGAVKQYPDRFIGLVYLSPNDDLAIMDQFEKGIDQDGMKGVKVHSWFHDYDPGKLLLPVAERCIEMDLPILIHIGGRPDTANVQALLDSYPDLKLILAHAGVPFFEQSWEQTKKYKNVHVDISGPYMSGSLVRKVVKTVGPDKIIFGTDAPYGLRTKDGSWTYAHSKAWVESLPISNTDKEKIFSGNLLKLMG